MKKYIFAISLSIMALFQSCKKEDLSKLGVHQKLEISSAYTGTDYTIDVFYPGSSFPDSPVPIVYVLDGFWYREMAAELGKELSSEGSIPTCLFVSIDYKKGDGVYARSKDLIYPGEGVEQEAEAPLFYQFLKEELIPQVESQFPSDTSRRTILGHSLGGLFVLYALLDNAEEPLFSKIVAASCSIGMGLNNYLFQKEAELAQNGGSLDAELYIGCGNLVGSAPVMHQEFYERLKARNYPNLNLRFELFPNTHGTDTYPSYKNGLKYVFSY